MGNATIEEGYRQELRGELEAWTRLKVRKFVQGIVGEEVIEFLRRKRSDRRSLMDGGGYRNGYVQVEEVEVWQWSDSRLPPMWPVYLFG